MGALGSALVRGAALGACLALAACATPPKLSPNELESRVKAQLAKARALDAEFEAYKAASAGARPSASPAGGPYYNSSSVKLQPLEPRLSLNVQQMLSSALEQRGATRFEYVGRGGSKEFTAPWSAQRFDDVPMAVQYAASLAAQPALRGAETDLRVPFKDGSARLVSVWNDGDRIEATDGADAALPAIGAGGPQPEPIRARYGVGPIEGWSAGELASLERALSLLSARELAAIDGLPFRRRSDAPPDLPKPPPGLLGKGPTQQCGSFQWRAGNRWIEMYDCAFSTESLGFVGRPDRPLPPSVRMIVHEIGHALGKKATVDLLDRMLPQYGEAKSLVAEYNRQGLMVPTDQVARYKQIREDIGAISTTLNRWSAAVNAGAGSTSPVIAQFDQVRGGVAFTAYGRWNSDEAFAEAFSLYRTDPDACRRISPPVVAFFEADRHVPASP